MMRMSTCLGVVAVDGGDEHLLIAAGDRQVEPPAPGRHGWLIAPAQMIVTP
jgi:hypothetical protein